MTLPAGIDAKRLLEEAIREKVLVPGSCYFANGGGEDSPRFNFSACGEEKPALGIARLERAIYRSGGPA